MTTDSNDEEQILGAARPAGFWIRVAAALIDFLILLPAAALTILFTVYQPSLIAVILVLLLTAAYKPLMEHFYGATVGKMACKLRVIDDRGNFLGMGEAWIRYTPWLVATVVGVYLNIEMFGRESFHALDGYISYVTFLQSDPEIVRLSRIQQFTSLIPLLSALVMLFNKPKQAAHDILANSYVVYRQA
ncbi:putative RDD family membrane protein YckC [Lewinella aquimaris]|uniref:Putative RDD family membrane protein YckC n=1 Tax=Neolewinella aquimaris TaxID=1835722 RepID=A0A840E8M7_9BACT|nr:RDD family protein [Neolewinella aquimaris]MBB4078149.1 putative RDD family membrane protein YckC [Neolewinella aquimaris]